MIEQLFAMPLIILKQSWFKPTRNILKAVPKFNKKLSESILK